MNLDTYTKEMTKSIWDKAFFMGKIPGAKCIIDFGCADASMICALGELFTNIDFYGYDINEELIKRADINIAHATGNVHTVYGADGLDNLISRVKRTYKPHEICINFSSVLHEVFSSSPSGKAAIKRLIYELHPKYITIRDMYFHVGAEPAFKYVNVSPFTDVDEKYITDFELVYGNLDEDKNLMHFLMKYQWKDNGWSEELNENYFAWTIDDIHEITENMYTVVFESHYQLPYLTELWKDKFFLPHLHTHAQFILRGNE